MVREFTTAGFLLASLVPALAGFEEFERPTVDFDRPHQIGGGSLVCQTMPSQDDLRPADCYVLDDTTTARVKFVAHGILEPQFWIEPKNRRLKPGWVIRNSIAD